LLKLFAVFIALEKVKVYGVTAVALVAERTYELLNRTAKHDLTERNLEQVNRQEEELLKAIRADLGIPVGAIDPAQMRESQ
jgi:hypothetical protein